MIIQKSSQTSLYPCDYGMGNGPRGFHHFQASPNGIVVCIYCGAEPSREATYPAVIPVTTGSSIQPMPNPYTQF